MKPLPITPLLPQIVEAMAPGGKLLLEAPTGAGKTTRVPPALLDALQALEAAAPDEARAGSGHAAKASTRPGEIWVLEPRRLAARLAARQVAHERGERCGERVGYELRFDRMVGPRTRIRFMTAGLFVRKLLAQPTLPGVQSVVIDEFHERGLDADLSLALLTRLGQTLRPELSLGVMSATLEGLEIERIWPTAKRLRSEGRLYPVEIEYLEGGGPKPGTRGRAPRLEDRVVSAARKLLREVKEAGPGAATHGSTVLVFVPGVPEIHRVCKALTALREGTGSFGAFEVAPLHGQMSAAAQDQALRSEAGAGTRFVVSTNVAESSITVPGVYAVIDCGLTRRAGHDAWSGLPSLETVPASLASLTQRAGRAGRLAPGRCLRLFSERELATRADHDPPELLRQDLGELRLLLAGLPQALRASLPFLDPPPAPAWEAAGSLLRRLGLFEPASAEAVKSGAPNDLKACGDPGVPSVDQLSPWGERTRTLGLSPRLGAVLGAATELGVGRNAAALVALMSDTQGSRGDRSLGRPGGPVAELSDPLARLRASGLWQQATRSRGQRHHGQANPGDRQLQQLTARFLKALPPEQAMPEAQQALRLRQALLCGWPDRVALRRAPRSERFVLAEGGELRLSPHSLVREAPLIVAIEAKRGERGGREPVLYQASAIDEAWLLDRWPERFEDAVELAWNEDRQAVDAFSRLRFGHLSLAESRVAAADQPGCASLLVGVLRQRGLAKALDLEALQGLRTKLRLLGELDPGRDLPQLGDEQVWPLVERACTGYSRLEELKTLDLVAQIQAGFEPALQTQLRQTFPKSLKLPGRANVPIHYPNEGPPYVASKLQHFFGLKQTPTLAGGRLRLQVQLLAPNGRPVQITQDLEGFWERTYPQVRRELRGRYPKHRWPEQPH